MAKVRVELPARLEGALLSGHPWVYREQVPRSFSAPGGGFVQVRAGRFTGFALWDPDSPLALRIYSRKQEPDAQWLARRARDAWALRAGVRAGRTNAFRWIYGEADSLPGLVIDYYAGHAVAVCDTNAARPVLDALVPSLTQIADLSSVSLRHRNKQHGEARLSVLWGEAPPEKLHVEENGLSFLVDLRAGQKTGLFLDHRENRARIEQVAKGRRVLNLYSYTGAFSLYALRGGAASVVNVDIAGSAAADAEENVRLNGLPVERHSFEASDVFDYLEEARKRRQSFDLIICDPPNFARNKGHIDKALKAYERVNAAGMKLATEGALYAAASCTARVSPPAFKTTLANSARRAKQRMQVIQEHGQPMDHPELIGHPEGRYLKFVLGRLMPYS